MISKSYFSSYYSFINFGEIKKLTRHVVERDKHMNSVMDGVTKYRGDLAKCRGSPAKCRGGPAKCRGDPAKCRGCQGKSMGGPVMC